MEKITLRLFWTFMLLCATSFIISIWFGDKATEYMFKTTATLFAIGFANFLIWAPMVIYRLFDRSPSN